jgi:hypothetical protein
MVKIGITTLIPYAQYSKYFDNSEILTFVETVYNKFIENNKFNKLDIILVTNGYPFINHVPVKIYLQEGKDKTYAGIELSMLTEINYKAKIFANTHEGRSLNKIHDKCKELTGIDSLEDLSQIVQERKKNQKSIIKRGWTQGNTQMVRNCDYILVFGIGEHPEGELWNKILCIKEYFNIEHFYKK